MFLKFLGLLSGIVFFQTEVNRQAGIINVSGAIFFFLTSVSFNNIGSVVFVSVCNSFSVIISSQARVGKRFYYILYVDISVIKP